jgi:CubicO group peptidase (beta-lactamase class C family)
MPNLPVRHRSACRVAAAVLLSVAGLAAAPASAQARPYVDTRAPPEGPAGAIVTALVEALEAGTAPAVSEFLAAYATPAFRDAVPLDEHVHVFQDFARRAGGLEFCCMRSYDPPDGPGEHVAVLRGGLLEDWHALVIQLAPEDPSRLAGLRFAPARPPSDLPPAAPLDLQGALAELDGVVGRLAAADRFAGCVLVAKDGEVLYERAVGPASRSFDVPNRIRTKFNLGSMNKMFTAVAVAQLAEQGRLSLDDSLDTYVDESWLPKAVSSRIRLRHLLNHTSGLGSYFNDTFWNGSRALYRALDDYKPLIRDDTPAFEPGTDESYSNTGFFLLGVVIERVTGSDYFEHVRAAVHAPAGMPDTDCYELDRPVPDLAVGYVPEVADDGTLTWRNNLFMHVIRGGPAGGGYSTVRDLLAFDRALRSGTLLGEEWREQLWTARPEEHAPGYGYGFAVEQGPLGRVVGHGGGFPGLNGQLDMYLDAGYTVAVLSNVDRGAGPVARAAGALLARVE